MAQSATTLIVFTSREEIARAVGDMLRLDGGVLRDVPAALEVGQ